MLSFNPELRTAPRSAHYQPRSIGQAARAPDPFVVRRSRTQPDARFAAVRVAPDTLAQDKEEHGVPPRQSTMTPVSRRETATPRRMKPRVHPLLLMGTGLLMALLLWVGVTQVIAWGNGVLDLLRYGNPRTYQTDAAVGQGDTAQHPNHFIEVKWDHFLDSLFLCLCPPPRLFRSWQARAPFLILREEV